MFGEDVARFARVVKDAQHREQDAEALGMLESWPVASSHEQNWSLSQDEPPATTTTLLQDPCTTKPSYYRGTVVFSLPPWLRFPS